MRGSSTGIRFEPAWPGASAAAILRRVHAIGLAEPQRLGEHAVVRQHDRLVDELGRLAGAGCRPCASSCPRCRITGAMRAIAASGPPAMMASVPVSAAPGPPDTGASTNCAPRAVQLLGDAQRRLDLGGRVIDHHLAGDVARRDAARPERRVLDRRRVDHADEDDVGGLRDLGGARGRPARRASPPRPSVPRSGS